MQVCIALVLAAALLAACSSSRPQRVDASAPTVTYRYANDEQRREAAEMADDYCDELYDAKARPLELWSRSGEASFRCVPD